MPWPRAGRARSSPRDSAEGRSRRQMDYLKLFLIATATAFATGLGAVPVYFLGPRTESLRPVLWGCTVGVMTLASILGLLKPALDEGDGLAVWTGLAAGAAFLFLARRWLSRRQVHIGAVRGVDARTVTLVFGVLFVHSLPEGLAIGTAYASDRADLSLFVILAIALQNISEGTSVALPMDRGRLRVDQPVLGRSGHERSAAGRSSRRLRPCRARAPSSAVLIRVRGGRHAGSRRAGAAPGGARARPAKGGRPRDRRRRRGDGDLVDPARRLVVGGWSDDDERARRVMRALRAHGAEQKPGEPAVAA